VKTLADWPKGTRRRGWGHLHDQVWFPVPLGVFPRPGTTETMSDGEEYQLYLDRWMIWTPFGTLRIHTFHQGDDDCAPHDHPWWFITFPLQTYTETVQTPDGRLNSRPVKRWRFHFRSALHRHFVHDPGRPIKTIIWTGNVINNWSFWPDHRTRVKHREWTNYNREAEG
jgi:hypothetical protein